MFTGKNYFLLTFITLFTICIKTPDTAEISCYNKNSLKTEVHYATGFSVNYEKGYKIVTARGPGQNYRYLLVQKDCPIPDNTEKLPVITVPVEKFASMSTTHIPHIEKLGIFPQLAGFSSSADSSNPELQTRIKQGQIIELGPEHQPDIEKILTLKPELIFTYGIERIEAHYKKLIDLGIPVVLNSEFMENSPLGYAEWIKFTALFFNLEEKAATYFKSVEQEYNRLQKLAKTVEHKPSVFLNTVYSDSWFMPGGNSFMAKLIADAGGDYILATDESNVSLSLSFEYVFQKAWDADIWLTPGNCKNLNELSAENIRYRLFQAFQKKMVYNSNRKSLYRQKNDYWENGITNPHKLLAELIAIFHPRLIPDQQFEWFHRLK
jgi:iron complex transport system substrate-binding protein